MKNSKCSNKKFIVVLTPGRSGSSMLMKMLKSCGVKVPGDLIAGRYENPNGFFEDSGVVSLNRSLLGQFGLAQPNFKSGRWYSSPSTDSAVDKIINFLECNYSIDSSNEMTAIKDPRIATLLPLWIRALNKLKIDPIFLLAIRSPEVVSESQAIAYGTEKAFGEYLWLSRVVDALTYTAGNCFIIHYENWKSPEVQARSLLNHLNLEGGELEENISNVCKIIDPKLDRASKGRLESPCNSVKEMYSVLARQSGADFNREELMLAVSHAQSAAAKELNEKILTGAYGDLSEELQRTCELFSPNSLSMNITSNCEITEISENSDVSIFFDAMAESQRAQLYSIEKLIGQMRAVREGFERQSEGYFRELKDKSMTRLLDANADLKSRLEVSENTQEQLKLDLKNLVITRSQYASEAAKYFDELEELGSQNTSLKRSTQNVEKQNRLLNVEIEKLNVRIDLKVEKIKEMKGETYRFEKETKGELRGPATTNNIEQSILNQYRVLEVKHSYSYRIGNLLALIAKSPWKIIEIVTIVMSIFYDLLTCGTQKLILSTRPDPKTNWELELRKLKSSNRFIWGNKVIRLLTLRTVRNT